jgi:hypothetical protein
MQIIVAAGAARVRPPGGVCLSSLGRALRPS